MAILLAALAAALLLLFRQRPTEPGRVAKARLARDEAVRAHCLAAGVSYPPRELYLRAFKHEAQLEAWARGDDGPFRLVKTFPVLASSGRPGPKRREGDLQVPEGFYKIDRFNPESSFHLSLGLNYPNAADLILSDRDKPGFDIFIHGGSATIGCLPIGDAGIEELYLLALDTSKSRRPIPVHIFPARPDGPAWKILRAEYPQHAALWTQLQPAYAAFERNRSVPEIEVAEDGAYRTH